MTIGLAIGSATAQAKARHEPVSKPAQPSKGPFGDIPKGPIEIFVSIDQQKLHLYSDGAHIADTSVATGVPSLPTPLGVFSVIQKQIFHRSNIYSGAPMPFMQRITWSGVALHEGESIGHRASHGCIRMPGEFARRLYALTKIGARVIVANEELKPSEFADPHLFVHKIPAPLPAAPAVAAAPKTDAPAVAPPGEPVPQTVAAAEPPKAASVADDAKPVEIAAKPDADVSPAADSRDAAASPASEPAPAAPAASGDAKPAEAAPAATAETPADSQPQAPAQAKPLVASMQAVADSDPPKTAQASAPAAPQADVAAPVQAGAPAQIVQAPAPSVLQVAASPLAQQPSPALKEVAAVQIQRESLRGTDASPTVLVDAPSSAVPVPPNKPADAIQTPADKKTPIAIFISRKTQRIYVRQNFEPMFDAAIAIDHPEQPIGTHVFTAMSYLNDGSTFRWDVVSMPGAKPKARHVQAREIVVYDRYGRPHRQEVAEKPVADPAPPQTPAEALARIQIPQDIIDRISAMILPGSSLIISDQGLGDETGEGTDFVVVTSKS